MVFPSLKQGTNSYPPVILDFLIIIIYRKEIINMYQSPKSLQGMNLCDLKFKTLEHFEIKMMGGKCWGGQNEKPGFGKILRLFRRIHSVITKVW